MEEKKEKSRYGSPFSPFPYGSPLQRAAQSPLQRAAQTPLQRGAQTPLQRGAQTPFSGSPGQKLLLETFNRSRSNSGSPAKLNGDIVTPRLKGQDMYGGPVMFGSSARRSRLLASTPYSSAMRNRDRERTLSRSTAGTQGGLNSTQGLSTSTQGAPTPVRGNNKTDPPPTDAMSTTARLILDALDKMSTPIQDALKIPVPRAEKRKLVEEELQCSLSSPARRRPRLGGGPAPSSTALAGPPLRKNYSPLPATLPVRPKPPPPSAALASSASAPAPPTAPLFTPASAAGGKMRTKVAESGRERGRGEEEGGSLPAYLTNNVPVLQVPSTLPSINFGLPSSTSTPISHSFNPPSFTPTIAPTSSFSAPTTSASAPSSSDPSSSSATAPVLSSSSVTVTLAPSDPKKVTSEGPKDSTGLKNFSGPKDSSEGLKSSNNAPTSDTKSVSSDIMFSFNKPKPAVEISAVKSSPALADIPAKQTELKADQQQTELNTDPRYEFVRPRAVSTKTVMSVSAHYSFSSPSALDAALLAPKSASTVLVNFKSAAMPDVTNNVKAKGVNLIQVEKGGMPDITASTWTGASKQQQLKIGSSVLEALGKKN